jgi:hypothetical protein
MERIKSCRLFHDWTKWKQYKVPMQYIWRENPDKPVKYTALRQKRYCKVCNKMQDEEVRG